jgi:disulfide bond formation protein DsbB
MKFHGQALRALIWPIERNKYEWEAMHSPPDMQAGIFAGAVALSLLLGALLFQYVGGLPPCEMCHWQRWPHIAAALAGLIAMAMISAGFLPKSAARPLSLFAIVALAISGLIGIYHAGVEWMLWEGPTACTGLGFDPTAPIGRDTFRVVRCDVAAWRLFGISLAGYNALFSLGAAALSLMLLRRKR